MDNISFSGSFFLSPPLLPPPKTNKQTTDIFSWGWARHWPFIKVESIISNHRSAQRWHFPGSWAVTVWVSRFLVGFCVQKMGIEHGPAGSLKYRFPQLYFWQARESSRLSDAKCWGAEISAAGRACTLWWWMTQQQERCSGSFAAPGWAGWWDLWARGGLALDEILLDSLCFLISKTWAQSGSWAWPVSQRQKFSINIFWMPYQLT